MQLMSEIIPLRSDAVSHRAARTQSVLINAELTVCSRQCKTYYVNTYIQLVTDVPYWFHNYNLYLLCDIKKNTSI